MIDAWALARSFGWGMLVVAKATPTTPAPTRNNPSSTNRIRFTEKNLRRLLPLALALATGSGANWDTGSGVGSPMGMPGSDGVLKFLPSSAKACLPTALPLYDDTAFWLVSPAEPRAGGSLTALRNIGVDKHYLNRFSLSLMSTSPTTITDVARAAGVSKAAVSFALNDRPGIAADTRTRILAVARELGWTPSHRGRALSVSRALAVGPGIGRRPEP